MMARQNATSVSINEPGVNPSPRFRAVWNIMVVVFSNSPNVDEEGRVRSGVPRITAEKMADSYDRELSADWGHLPADKSKLNEQKKVRSLAELAQRVSQTHTPLICNVPPFLKFRTDYQARTASKTEDTVTRTTRALALGMEKKVCRGT